MKRLKYLLSIALLFITLPGLMAQVKTSLPLKKVPVNTINYEQGLLNNETDAIITDTLGFSWIGTFAGLQRYNGYTLENIDPVIGRDTLRIRSQVYLFRLANGNLWISCRYGVLEYNPLANVFRKVITLPVSSSEAFGIIPLSETGEDIWCLQKGAGIVIYNKTGARKQAFPSVDINTLDAVIRNGFIKTTSIIARNATHIFIKIGIHSLLNIDTKSHQYKDIPLPGDDIRGIACNADCFYTATATAINRYAINDGKFLGQYPVKNITEQPVTRCLVLPTGNNRVVVSVNGYLAELDAALNNTRLFTTFDGSPLLVAGVIDHIYHDAYNRIWLLTNDDIKRIQNENIPFSYLKYPDAGNNFVRSLYFDEEQHLLLAGCFGGGLQAYDSALNPLWREPLQTAEVKDVLAITKLSTGSYLVVTLKKGWFLFDMAKKKLTPFSFSAGKIWQKLLYDNAFSNNLQRLDDSTFIITCVSNAFRCTFKGNELRSVNPLLPLLGTAEDWINTCFQASDGALWVGQYKGEVHRVDKNGSVIALNLPEHTGIRCFTEDAEGHIWIGTSAGLYVSTREGKLIKSFYKSSGLLNDCIYSLLPIKGRPAVFAGSNMGLANISLNGNIKNYTKELGLQDNEFNTAAALTSASGRYYFGGISGITAFFPAALSASLNRPILNMTRLVVNDSVYNVSGIWRGDTVRVKYDQNHLQFDFAAMGQLNADKYFYRYRMTSFGDNWQSTHQPTGIRYILEPGTYTLEVACSSELGGPEARKNFVIIIDPPFWLRWWFFVLIGVCTIGVVTLVVSFYHGRRYEKALQEVMVKQRLQNQREQISRDLHDNLGAQANAIFYGTDLLMRNNEDREKLIGNLHDTAGDMLTVLRETLWAMKITEIKATELWLRVLNFARKLGGYYPGLTMSISGTAPDNIEINATMALNMILIIQEAINNAVRHSEASVITIGSHYNERSWRIEITDDGKGFDVKAISKKTESYGLENMAERANESKIAFNINSLPAHGTKVYLEIDLEKMSIQST